jgi:SAM-dependent methyltransferase
VSSSAFTPVQYEQVYPPGIEHHFWNLARNRVILSKVCRFVPSGARLLEIGCGRGIVVEYLRAHGLDCLGCELASLEVPPHLAGVLFAGEDAFGLAPGLRREIGALLVLDVLEHLSDPEEFLRRALDAYPEATRVLITLPARPELWSNYDEYYGHVRRYTLAMACELSARLPLRVLECRHFFHTLYLPMRLGRALGSSRDVVFAPPRARGLHRLLSRALAVDQQLLPGGWPGTSIIAVFERRS